MTGPRVARPFVLIKTDVVGDPFPIVADVVVVRQDWASGATSLMTRNKLFTWLLMMVCHGIRRSVNIILCLVHFLLIYPELFTKFPEMPWKACVKVFMA